MKDSHFARWIRRMLETQEVEISCTQCQDLVSQYVDLELADKKPENIFPQLKQHLDQCQVCMEEYQILRDLARMENEGNPPFTEGRQDSAG